MQGPPGQPGSPGQQVSANISTTQHSPVMYMYSEIQSEYSNVQCNIEYSDVQYNTDYSNYNVIKSMVMYSLI